MPETTKVGFFAYLFATAAILLYAAVRFATTDVKINKVVIYSDTGKVEENVRRFLTENANNPRRIPSETTEKFPVIEFVSVKNNLNGTLDVRLRHRKIIGALQNDDGLYPLFEDGSFAFNAPLPAGQKLPRGLFKFKGATKDAGHIGRAMRFYPELAEKTDYLERIENRRWNVRLLNDAVIMLPEQDAAAAIEQIRRLGMAGKSFRVLDLRDPRRMLVK